MAESLLQTLACAAVAAFNPGEAETDTRTRPLNPTVPSPLPKIFTAMLPLVAEALGEVTVTSEES
jgi:hypothetical protein